MKLQIKIELTEDQSIDSATWAEYLEQAVEALREWPHNTVLIEDDVYDTEGNSVGNMLVVS